MITRDRFGPRRFVDATSRSSSAEQMIPTACQEP